MIPVLGPGSGPIIVRMMICSSLWGSGFLFMRLVGPDVSPVVLASVRAGIAAIALSVFFVLRGDNPLPQKSDLVPWLTLGTLNGWVPNILTAFAILHIATAQSAIIQAGGPLMVAVMAHLAFHDEKLTLRRIAGVLTGFCGMALLIGPAAFQGLSGEGLGFLAMLGVALCYALGNIYARFVREMPPARMALGQQVVSASVATFLALVWAGTAGYQPALDRAAPLLALGLFATAIPITVFMGLIRMAGPTKASMVGYLMPLWATFFALTFLGETINLRQMAGAAIILLGVFIVTTAPRRVV